MTGLHRLGAFDSGSLHATGARYKEMESDASEDGTVGSTSRDTVRDKDSNQVTLLFHLASFTWAAAGRCPPLPAMVGEISLLIFPGSASTQLSSDVSLSCLQSQSS